MQHGAGFDPPNRFERVVTERDDEHVAWDTEYLTGRDERQITYIPDRTKTIVSTNSSPDIPFTYSINPYRGCVHGCSYCYARPGHEYLGMNAGLDFETKIMVKDDAPDLFREFLRKKNWKPEPVNFSGVTDCYQPAERRFQLTRQCLEVAWECRLPVSIVTKNALITRDLDILSNMASENLVHVYVSVTTLDSELARVMEPRTSIPAARLRAIEMLAKAAVPVGVMVAPMILGLNDHEAAGILEQARNAGAIDARYILLRLPLTVEPVFREWLSRTQDLKAEKVENLIREARQGEMNSSTFKERMVGTGHRAEQFRQMFALFRKKHGFQSLPPYDTTKFVPPRDRSGQRTLF